MAARYRKAKGPSGSGSRVFAACGKVGFASRKLAKEQARVFRVRGRGPFRVYSCDECGFWHLTTYDGDHTMRIREARSM